MPQICASYCATIPDMEYMGLQGGGECFCGGSSAASFGRYGAADNCDLPCTGKEKRLPCSRPQCLFFTRRWGALFFSMHGAPDSVFWFSSNRRF